MQSVLLLHSGLLSWGVWSGLAIVVCLNAADAYLYVRADLPRMHDVPPLVDRLIGVSSGGTLPGLVVLAVALVVSRLRSRLVYLSVVVAVLAGVGMLAVPLGRAWAMERYSGPTHDAFSEWRSRIPVGSEVLWLLAEERVEEPATNVWLLLERPSFISGTQAPNALFSRHAALEMRDRARSLHGLVPMYDPFLSSERQPPEPEGPLLLDPICRTTKVRYIVTTRTMKDATAIPAPPAARPSLRTHKLYICP